MPWWGWLIAFAVLVFSGTAITAMAIITRSMKSINDDFERRWSTRQGPWRWP